MRLTDDKDAPKFKKLPLWVNILFFVILVLLYVQVVISEGGFKQKTYYVCNGINAFANHTDYCKNPFYNSSYCRANPQKTYCNLEYYTGIVGEQPGPMYGAFGWKVLLLLGVYGFFFFVYNVIEDKK